MGNYRQSPAGHYYRLGTSAQSERRFTEADASYRQALAIFQESGDRYGIASTHHQLGTLAQRQGRFGEADASYRQALAIFQDCGDDRSAADVYHQLGTLAQQQGRLAEADVSYRQALEIFQRLDDRYESGGTCQQLGLLAQEQSRFAEAEASYEQALAIFQDCGDDRSAADVYHQLGTLAQQQGRLAEADVCYRQALEIFQRLDDRDGAARTIHQLGILAQEKGRFAEADASYRQALGLKQQSGDRHSAAGTFHQLGTLAQRQGRFAEAEASYRQALKIFQEFGDRQSTAGTLHQLGTLARQKDRVRNDTDSVEHNDIVEHEPIPYGGHVFISYVREDGPQVHRLQRALEAVGVPVWRDTADLWPGQDWRQMIRSAITESALVFLACFSRASLARRRSYQNEELVLAIEQMRLRPSDEPWLIPVRFDDCEIPDYDLGAERTLTALQRADLFGTDANENAVQLTAAVQQILGKQSMRGDPNPRIRATRLGPISGRPHESEERHRPPPIFGYPPFDEESATMYAAERAVEAAAGGSGGWPPDAATLGLGNFNPIDIPLGQISIVQRKPPKVIMQVRVKATGQAYWMVAWWVRRETPIGQGEETVEEALAAILKDILAKTAPSNAAEAATTAVPVRLGSEVMGVLATDKDAAIKAARAAMASN